MQKNLHPFYGQPMLRLVLPESGAFDPKSLRRGRSYCIVIDSAEQRERLLEQFSALESSALVAHDGGLIGNLSIWENLFLPIGYHSLQIVGGPREKAVELLVKCGIENGEKMDNLLRRLPDELSLFEKRLSGFVRAMLMEPELMIYDTIFEGLTREDARNAAEFNRLFHLYFPFRTSILLSFDECGETALLAANAAAW